MSGVFTSGRLKDMFHHINKVQSVSMVSYQIATFFSSKIDVTIMSIKVTIMFVTKVTTTFDQKSLDFCFCSHSMQKPSKCVKTQ